MKKHTYKNMTILAVATIFLVFFIIIMISAVNDIQGNGRVVNYAGIVRGATQRLVKNELYGIADDGEIARLDDILLGLQTGQGSQNLTVLPDVTYQVKLQELFEHWEEVKQAIYDFREDANARSTLYELSESYFQLADEMVTAAEKFSDSNAQKIHSIEILIFLDIALIMMLLIYEIMTEIRNNRRLRRMAYVDPHTGLPNKRKCDEMLNRNLLIEENKNACCLMFDLNNLKITNDSLGHEAGDALIRSFASLLRRNAPADMFLGRFGGDEFIGIQMDCDKEEVLAFLNTLHMQAEQTALNPADNTIHISFAYGVAFSNEHVGCTIKTLMDIADKNMYENKNAAKQKQAAAR